MFFKCFDYKGYDLNIIFVFFYKLKKKWFIFSRNDDDLRFLKCNSCMYFDIMWEVMIKHINEFLLISNNFELSIRLLLIMYNTMILASFI